MVGPPSSNVYPVPFQEWYYAVELLGDLKPRHFEPIEKISKESLDLRFRRLKLHRMATLALA